jgi:hypothetical protein
MADEGTGRALTLNEQRDRTIQTLIDHFAEDRLTMEQLEQRLDAAHRALKPTELSQLTADLPAHAAPAPVAQPERRPTERPVQAVDAVREHQVMVAIMGGVEKKGRWTPARKNLVLAFMGGAELDFRDAILPPGETEVQIFTIWGGVEIIVPPGTHVDCNGVAIMGAFEHVAGPVVADAAAPTIRVTGFALMAGVEIHVRYPGETARDATQRRREERKRLREERKRLRGDS